jgi:nicotinate-nucleotide pyrophosphorylase (carboxylating)
MDWKGRRTLKLLEAALAEDRAAHDVTSELTIDPQLRATATILAKQDCVVAGLGCVSAFLDAYVRTSTKPVGRHQVVINQEIFDGVRVRKGRSLAVIRGNARTILACERVILNLLQRMCGVATITSEYVKAIAGTRTKVLDTRKTLPGLRELDKYAVTCGGGVNHRLDLQDGILIKNNHISLGGGLPKALAAALAGRKSGQRVQVEVRTRAELEQALAGGAEALLLDNMTPREVKRAVRLVHTRAPKVTTEASGGINLKTARRFAQAGVDFISVGALTHSTAAVDLSMRIQLDR